MGAQDADEAEKDLPDYKLKALDGARMDVREAFEKEKTEIEADIPEKVRSFYGRVNHHCKGR